MDKYVLITGASAGIGREFVFSVDRRYEFDEIWVIARREERLEELAPNCRNMSSATNTTTAEGISSAANRHGIQSQGLNLFLTEIMEVLLSIVQSFNFSHLTTSSSVRHGGSNA